MKNLKYHHIVQCIHLLLIFAFIAVSCSTKSADSLGNMTPIMNKALYDTNSVFYADFSSFPQNRDTLPIGVFDSGTGGLTVLEAFLKADNYNNLTGAPTPDGIPDFAWEDFQYLADQANMPYGTYPSEGKEDYLRELAVKDALFLLGDEGAKQRCKIVVIACNTATAYGYKDIKTLLKSSKSGVKVIGVINAGVNATFDMINSSESKDSISIGVLATVGTISSNAYENTIAEKRKELNYQGYISVVNQGCSGFAEAVDLEKDFVDPSLNAPRESYRGPKIGTAPDDIKLNLLDIYNFDYSNGHILKHSKGDTLDLQLNSAANYARFHLVSIFEKLRRSKRPHQMKAIILGCTHYPFLLDTLNKVIDELRVYRKDDKLLYAHLIAPDFQFIDPAAYTVAECYNELRKESQLAYRTRRGNVNAYISVASKDLTNDQIDEEGGLSYKFKYGRKVGTEDKTTDIELFSLSNIKEDNLMRLERLVPLSYSKIKEKLKVCSKN